MVRNPIDDAEKRYMKNISKKTIHPKIFYRNCECCHHDYKKEPIFRITKGYLGLDMARTYYGCTHCFYDMDDFQSYLEAKGELLSKNDFDFQREILERDPMTATPDELRRLINMKLM